MKQWIVVVALLGCAHAAPPWPKRAASETDGGESLAPREARSVVVAAKEAKPEAKPAAESRPAADVKPAATPAAEPAPAAPPNASPLADEEGEETIVIEVED